MALIAPAGVYAGISVFSGIGITINDASAVVALRGLTINGQGGLDGIRATAVSALHVEQCVIGGVGSDALLFLSPGKLFVSDSLIRDVVGNGIYVSPSSGSATGVIDHTTIERAEVENGIFLNGAAVLR